MSASGQKLRLWTNIGVILAPSVQLKDVALWTHQMTSALPNDSRVTARLPQAVKDTLQKAADLTGASLNQFIVQAAVKEAQNVIEQSQIIHLPCQEADRIFELVENPPEHNQRLKQAIQRHREFFSEDN